jgi:hypothetical protein
MLIDMKSLQTSYGKNYLSHVLLSLFIASLAQVSIGCGGGIKTRSDLSPTAENSLDNSSGSKTTKTESTPVLETSLKSDNAVIEELRKNIPEEKRKDNDELKEILSLTGEVKDPPARIREKFMRTIQRMRDTHRRESQKMRQTFSDNERKNRDAYKRKSDAERKEFNDDKQSKEDRKEFYDRQDQTRKDFFAEERDKRNIFNSDMRSREDEFSNMIRDRQQDFNLEIRAYEIRYKEHMKQLEAQKKKY